MDDSLLTQYLRFSRSPTRDRATRTDDYYQLQQLPFLEWVTFLKDHNDVLILVTKPVELVDEDTDITHVVGSFLVFLKRTPTEYAWEIDIQFRNLNWISKENSEVHHPHIAASRADFGVVTGRLCISGGQHTLYHSLREGRVVDTARYVHKILHTYMPENYAYAPLNRWPKKEVPT